MRVKGTIIRFCAYFNKGAVEPLRKGFFFLFPTVSVSEKTCDFLVDLLSFLLACIKEINIIVFPNPISSAKMPPLHL